jgi:hypothetical protein
MTGTSDPTGAIKGIRGTIETGFGKPTCSYFGHFESGESQCVSPATKMVTQLHVEDPQTFPLCDEHYDEFKDAYPMVVVQEL